MNQRSTPRVNSIESTHPATSMLPFSIASSNRDYTSASGLDAESLDHLLQQESETPIDRSSSSSYRKEKYTSPCHTLCLYWKTSCIFLYKRFDMLSTHIRVLSQTNIYFVVFATFFFSICFGIVFYSNWHAWEISTSFYYSSQVLLGNMYGIPVELDGFSQAFTMAFFLWGSALIATFHLVATSNEFLHLQRLSALLSPPVPPPAEASDSTAGGRMFIYRIWVRLYGFMRSNFQSSYFTATCSVVWVILGTLFGVLYEKWTVAESLYFAVGAMSAAGIPNPSCYNGDDEFPLATCQLGPFRGCAMGVYLIVGVPLFAFTIGHVAGFLVFSVTNYSRQKIFLRRQQLVRDGKARLNYQLLLDPADPVEGKLAGSDDSINALTPMSKLLVSVRPAGSVDGNMTEKSISVKEPNMKLSPPKAGSDQVDSMRSPVHRKSDEQESAAFALSSSGVSNSVSRRSSVRSPRDESTFAYESFEKFQYLLESSDDINAYFLRELLVTRKVQLADVQQIYVTLCQSAALSLSAEAQSSSSTADTIAGAGRAHERSDRDVESDLGDEDALLSPGRDGAVDGRSRDATSGRSVRSQFPTCRPSSTGRFVIILCALLIFLLVCWSYKETFI